MAFKQRISFASTWAFEDIGVQDIGIEVKFVLNVSNDSSANTDGCSRKALPHLDCHCEYLRHDDLLVVKGHLNGSVTKIAGLYSTFIEEQKNKDLLDMPRTRQLDIPIMLQDEGASVPVATTEDSLGGLLALDVDSDEELIHHSHLMTRVTKFWLSSHGGIGCFATGFHEVLTEVAAVTGTDITLIDEAKGIQISGNSAGDVDDALAKLTRIEKPLSCLVNPKMGNMGIATEDKTAQYSIQNYGSLNQVALRRVLTEPGTSSLGISQMFVTISLPFDEETQSYMLPKNVTKPQSIGKGPDKSIIWQNYTFPGVGKGDEFVLMESAGDTNIPAATSVISLTHPFLTAEKAKQVNEWVAEGKEMEATSKQPEHPPTPPPPESSSNTTLVPGAKRAPAIKTRRPIPSNQSVPLVVPVAISERVKTPDLVPKKEDVTTPRRKWKMTYSAESGNTDLRVGCPRPASPCELRDAADSFLNASTPAPKPRLPLVFDETKHELNKHPRLLDIKNNDQNALKAQRKGDYVPSRTNRKLDTNNLLVDVTAAAAIRMNSLPMMRADQPALIPLNADLGSEQSVLNSNAPSRVNNIADDLNGLVIEADRGSSNELGCPILHEGPKPCRNDNISEQVKRLVMLEEVFLEQTRELPTISEIPARVANSPIPLGRINAILTKRRLEELERRHKAEGKQPSDEMATREFHHTMNHKAPKPSHNASSKSSRKAKRQATLEDAWGIPKKPTKKDNPAPPGNMEAKGTSSRHTAQENVRHAQKRQAELSMDESIKQLFEILKPTLEAAEYFPGSLNLEVQIGLALIPVLPKTYEEGLASLREWTEIMQPQTGVSAPTTKFIDRLTTSGSDVDYIVNLKTSQDGKRRFFEHEDNEYSVIYEFHCLYKTNQPIIVEVDERGKYSIKKPAEPLGAVNIHFPGSVWDARMIVRGNIAYPTHEYREFEDAARYMVDHLWVPPDKHTVRLFTKLSKNEHLTVQKIFMKRWTRYRYIHSNDFSLKGTNTPDTSSSTGGKADSATGSVGSKSAANDTVSEDNSENPEAQDLLLQVTEVQDLLIGSNLADTQAIRARCAPLSEMIRNGRQWYEVSLVSSAIDAILKTNANIEVGERTDDWRSLDLFGNDAILLHDSRPGCADTALPSRPVATAVGAAGIGNLLRLTKVVVQNMDGVGFWNCGPCVDAARMPVAGSLNTPSIPNRTNTSPMGAMIKTEKKSLNFDELESIKEVGSSIGDVPVTSKPNVASSDQKKEQIEIEYW
ncbi:hypothetical protein COH20_003366 [Aspergillus flavus]|uniref:Uncharacterized protein n=1 Tax=Aspergillus flavus TaxID=5059 RepID=A0AB74CL26_ASPFL|nr:hypothetical protein NYO67_4134 [Aspergillus flavus]RAQ71404.1 hypothetical protein COH20_003366 [Aspergillus flavus]RAQ75117.1 hypothetical protein COH21_004888 [Aspergillus flavus]RMZ47459.1 hypothetical protein CA14_010360 [Aspergillus flavus]